MKKVLFILFILASFAGSGQNILWELIEPISAQPELLTPDSADYLLIQDVSEGTPKKAVKVSNIFKSVEGLNKENYIIESTSSSLLVQNSSWFAINRDEQIGIFKATVTITDLSLFSLSSYENIMGFDFSDSANELTSDNTVITNPYATVSLSIDAITKNLIVSLSGMPTNDKRIFLCLERCYPEDRIPLGDFYNVDFNSVDFFTN